MVKCSFIAPLWHTRSYTSCADFAIISHQMPCSFRILLRSIRAKTYVYLLLRLATKRKRQRSLMVFAWNSSGGGLGLEPWLLPIHCLIGKTSRVFSCYLSSPWSFWQLNMGYTCREEMLSSYIYCAQSSLDPREGIKGHTR